MKNPLLQIKLGYDTVSLMQKLAKQQGCPILITTYDNQILDIADHIVKLENGYLLTQVV